jgi:glycosyltransferase involved in cell wall biosynthesis
MTHDRPGVLMVTGAYVPEMSGAGLQCRALVRQLGDLVQFTVLTTTTDPSLPAKDERDGVPIHRVFVDPRSAWSKLTAAVRMTRVLRGERGRFSIVHLHGFSQKSMLLVVFALLSGKKIAIKLTSVGHDDPASIRAGGSPAYWCYSQAHRYFAVSPRLKELYEASDLPPGRFRLIPNGVDRQRFHPALPEERRKLRAELGLSSDGPLILFVGFFSHEKCPDLLFDAWSRLSTHGDRSSVLVFVGATRSDYYEVDERIAAKIRDGAARLGLESRVHFVESTQEIEKYQRAADIFVLPSMREGLPNALLEAMACGAACVATRLPGVTDSLIADHESGLLVPVHDTTALEAALAHLIADPDRAREMGERARQRIERDFSLTQTARQYLAAYQEMLAL